MSGREKIIVGLMICSLVYGVYHFRAKITPKVLKLQQIENQIKNKIEPDIVLSEKEKYILKQVSVSWANDPFAVSVPRQTKQAKNTAPPAPKNLNYSGYLKMGERILAIIDSMEYQVGDVLLNSQYLISDITPKEIIISLPGGINSTHIPIRDSG